MTDGAVSSIQAVYNKGGYAICFPKVGAQVDLREGVFPDPYSESSTPLFPIGTVIKDGGDEWAYSKAGGTGLDIAAPIQAAIAVHAEQNDDIAVGAASAIGDYTVSLTSTDNLDGSPNDEEDAFKDGFLIVNDAAGEGQMYKIKSNKPFDADESEAVFTLYDPLTIALTTDSQCGLMKNPQDLVIATTAVMTGVFAGIPQIAVTANYYFWSKVKGPAACNPHAAIPIGDMVVVGTTAAQADPMAAFTTETIIGTAMTPAITDGEYFMVKLIGV